MFVLLISSSQPKEEIKTSEGKGLIPGKSADCYNGAVLDRYSWSQTIKDIEVKIPVPSSVTKGRDVGVEIKSSHLKVWLKKGASPESGTILLSQGKVLLSSSQMLNFFYMYYHSFFSQKITLPKDSP